MIGEHDFSAFATSPRSAGSTVRRVYEAGWHHQAGELIFGITANAFLYHMVRRLVNAQVVVAQGRLESDAILIRLMSDQHPRIQGIAPRQGLVLIKVNYE